MIKFPTDHSCSFCARRNRANHKNDLLKQELFNITLECASALYRGDDQRARDLAHRAVLLRNDLFFEQ